jgi:hypothetical protein
MQRLQVRHLLLWVVLASLMCMAVRSLLVMDPIGILVWPVLLGFGADRLRGGRGVWGGTAGGLLAFAAAAVAAFCGGPPSAGGWSDPRLVLVSVLTLAAGICWGFYLSVWVYMIVETVLQWL